MRIRMLFAAGLAGLVGGLLSLQAAEDPKPGTVIPSAFRAFLVTDGRFPPTKLPGGKEEPDARNRAGKIHCLVCENGLAPVIGIFVRNDLKNLAPDKGVGALISQVNRLISIPKYRAQKLAAFVMFLRLEDGTKTVTVKTQKDGMEVETKIEQDLEYPDDEKRKEYVDEIKQYATAVNAPNVPFGLAAKKSKALTEWSVKDDEVTVVLYYRMRFVNLWRFQKDSEVEPAIPTIIKSTEDLLAEKK